MPTKSSPKPARIAPSDRQRPRATNQSSAPTPSSGIAAEAMRRRRPNTATIHGVEVVPRVAPTMTPTACGKVISPALTKPMTVSVAAVEDWIRTVKTTPEMTALNRPDTRRCNARRTSRPPAPSAPR